MPNPHSPVPDEALDALKPINLQTLFNGRDPFAALRTTLLALRMSGMIRTSMRLRARPRLRNYGLPRAHKGGQQVRLRLGLQAHAVHGVSIGVEL